MLGDSTARLLQPAELNPGFGARFANLAMNSATAYEQSRMLQVFLRAHPQPRVVVIALDQAWCSDTFVRYTPRPFPEWMYRTNLWPAYRYMLTPYAVQEAANQFAVMVHLKRRRYGLDGYTSFVPPESAYDPVRRDRAFLRWPAMDHSPAPVGAEAQFPSLPLLDAMLRSLPNSTRKVLFFVPYNIQLQGAPGSATAWRWAKCKEQATDIAERDGAELLDFMIPSAITSTPGQLTGTRCITGSRSRRRIVAGLVRGESPDAVRLVPPPEARETALRAASQGAARPGMVRRMLPNSIALPGGTAPVVWRRSARARRISLRIEPRAGGVVVTLPPRASAAAGRAVLLSNQGWVAERLARLPQAVALGDGASVPVDGRPHLVVHRPGLRGGRVEGGRDRRRRRGGVRRPPGDGGAAGAGAGAAGRAGAGQGGGGRAAGPASGGEGHAEPLGQLCRGRRR